MSLACVLLISAMRAAASLGEPRFSLHWRAVLTHSLSEARSVAQKSWQARKVSGTGYLVRRFYSTRICCSHLTGEEGEGRRGSLKEAVFEQSSEALRGCVTYSDRLGRFLSGQFI